MEEKHIQDNSNTDPRKVSGQDPDRYEQGYGSFNEKDFDKEPVTKSEEHLTPGGTRTGTADSANDKSSLNEDESTISNTHAPSESISEEKTNSNPS